MNTHVGFQSFMSGWGRNREQDISTQTNDSYSRELLECATGCHVPGFSQPKSRGRGRPRPGFQSLMVPILTQ